MNDNLEVSPIRKMIMVIVALAAITGITVTAISMPENR